MRSQTRQILRQIPSFKPSLRSFTLLAPLRNSNNNKQEIEPAEKAKNLIDAVPANFATKTGLITVGAALSTFAVSKELYVVNEESVVLGTFVAICYAIAKYVKPVLKDWADERTASVNNVLYDAQKGHVDTVKSRIATVSERKEVVNITKDLYAMARETAEMEAAHFEKQQTVDYVNEARNVLDSWVRFEANLKQRQQEQLAASIKERISKQLNDASLQKQILAQSVADVERIVSRA